MFRAMCYDRPYLLKSFTFKRLRYAQIQIYVLHQTYDLIVCIKIPEKKENEIS